VTCEEISLSLGAYVLGALEPEERRQVREHVSGCPACAVELAELERLPAVLDRVRLEDLQDGPVTPSPDFFDRVASAAAAEDRRVRRRWLLVAAALAVLFLGGAGAALWVNRDITQSASVQAGDVHVTVRTQPDDSGDGTIFDVTASGLEPQSLCRLVVVDDDGGQHTAGSWMVDYEGQASYEGWSDVPPSEVDDLLMFDGEGNEIARVDL
jgi:hypothetical protein